MKRHHIHIVVAAAMCLLFNMTRPYISHNEVYENVISELQKQMETSFNVSHDVMSAPHFQNTIPAPHVQFTTLKKVQTTTNNTVIPKRLPTNFKFFGPKTSPQSLCCFASPNDFFVVMLRHFRI
ncbi:MAG: hypothetical protein KBT67_09605 [bacterium]|nr:hypothetical protein [Candidatus Limimorpha caballi]